MGTRRGEMQLNQRHGARGRQSQMPCEGRGMKSEMLSREEPGQGSCKRRTWYQPGNQGSRRRSSAGERGCARGEHGPSQQPRTQKSWGSRARSSVGRGASQVRNIGELSKQLRRRMDMQGRMLGVGEQGRRLCGMRAAPSQVQSTKK